MNILETQKFVANTSSLLNENNYLEVASEILTVQAAVQTAQDILKNFTNFSDFHAKTKTAFGESFNVTIARTLAQAWKAGDFSTFPEIEIRSANEINNALGAFAITSNKIYLSREFVNQGDVETIASVLLEEYGHYLDSQINAIDTPGDEGEILAALAQGKVLSESELANLKGEDDSAIVLLDGEEVAIEQANIQIQTEKFDFFANDVNLSQNSFSQEFRYNDLKFSRQLAGTLPFGLNADIFDAKFDYDFNASIGLIPYLQLKQLGKTEFKYPLSVNTFLPSQLDLNETSLIDTSSYQVELNDLSIKGSGFSLLKGGLDFEYDLGPWKIDSSLQSKFFGINQNENLLDLANIKDKFNLFETSFDVPIVDVSGAINLGKFVELKVTLPEIKEFKQKPSTGNSFPSVEATGKADVISLTADIDKFLVERAAIASLPLAILIAAIDLKSKQFTGKSNLELNFNGLGFSLRYPNPKKENSRVSLEASLDILDVGANLKLGLQQDFKLAPDVQVTMSVDKGLVDESLTSTKPLGEEFNITAPSEGTGVMEVKAKYELIGNIENDLGLILDGNEALKAEFLKGKFELNLGKWFKIPSVELPALGSLKIPGDFGLDASLNLKKYVSSNDSSALVKIDPLELQKIEGIEKDENNPQANATKNLIVEKVYKIPYGVPIFISDGTSVTEKNDAGASQRSQAYFTYNSKYYEWQPRTVQLFTGSGGDVLSQIALETLGDASPNAYNFIAFHNNISNPNLIVAGSTIQVPKEVTLPDTTGYAIFQVGSRASGGSAKINYNTTDGTATAGSDYIATSGTLSVPAGQGGVILVPIVGDTKKEETENFTVTLTRSDGTAISEGVDKLEATGTIFDDDEKPDSPENQATTFNDPRIVTFDGQYNDFQAAGEFLLVESTSGDLKIQVRQEPLGNDRLGSVSENTAVATVLGGQRIGIYRDRGLLINGNPVTIANNDSIFIGDGRIYREGNIYTIVYSTGDQLVAIVGNRVNVRFFAKEERQGQIKGLLGNFNRDLKDELTKRDGTVLTPPVTLSQLYDEYADSWRITQAESLFDYQPGEDTNTFTNRNFPRQKVTLRDLDPADILRAEQAIGDRITNPIIREATIIDYILTGFDETIIEAAIASPIPESILIIATPPRAFEDFASTKVNNSVKINVLSNDEGTIGVPLAIANFDSTTTKGGTISIDDNATPDNKNDDRLIYTPSANFTGNETFNYTVSDGKDSSTAKVSVLVNPPFPPSAAADFSSTSVNTPVKIDVLSNDISLENLPLAIANFDQTSAKGSTIKLDDNNTPEDKTDDQLIYTPTANFTGKDTFNYTIFDGAQTSTAKVTIKIADLSLAKLDGSNGFLLNGIFPGSFSGVAVNKLGDFNGDGNNDFIIGAFGADPNNNNAAGESYLVFGKKGGFPASIDLPNLDGKNGFILNGVDFEGFSGGTVSSAGDINNDGLDDLIIGAFAASANGQDNAGKAYVVFGSRIPFPTRFNLSQLNGSNGFIIQGNNEFDYLGLAASGLGDINGDGVDDLMVSSPGPLNGTTSKTYIIYGRKDSFPYLLNSTDINGTNGFVINDPDGKSGTSVSAAGDVNGDRISDLIINAEENDSNSYVIFGSGNGFSTNFNLSELNGTNGFILNTGEEKFDTSVSQAGDINGDGIDDLIVALASTNSSAGKSYVIFGSNKGFASQIYLSQLNGNNGFTIFNSIDGNSISSVSGAGDVNGDGIDDLTIGVSSAFGNGKFAAGKTYVLFGNNGGFSPTVNLSKINGTNGLVIHGINEFDLSGTSVSSSGDINNDGLSDIIIGSPGNLFNNSPGTSQVVFGSTLFGANNDASNLAKLLFNPGYYLSQNPDVQEAVNNGLFRNAFEHFITIGFAEGRNPSSYFASDYLINNPDVAIAVANGIIRSGFAHFIKVGVTEGRSSDSLLFALDLLYRRENSDVNQAIQQGFFNNGLEHLVFLGMNEGRQIFPAFQALAETFDSEFYLAINSDVKQAVESGFFPNALSHFISFGLTEGRDPSSQFSNSEYLANYPDIAAVVSQGILRNGFEHFIKFGFGEERTGSLVF